MIKWVAKYSLAAVNIPGWSTKVWTVWRSIGIVLPQFQGHWNPSEFGKIFNNTVLVHNTVNETAHNFGISMGLAQLEVALAANANTVCISSSFPCAFPTCGVFINYCAWYDWPKGGTLEHCWFSWPSNNLNKTFHKTVIISYDFSWGILFRH